MSVDRYTDPTNFGPSSEKRLTLNEKLVFEYPNFLFLTAMSRGVEPGKQYFEVSYKFIDRDPLEVEALLAE